MIKQKIQFFETFCGQGRSDHLQSKSADNLDDGYGSLEIKYGSSLVVNDSFNLHQQRFAKSKSLYFSQNFYERDIKKRHFGSQLKRKRRSERGEDVGSVTDDEEVRSSDGLDSGPASLCLFGEDFDIFEEECGNELYAKPLDEENFEPLEDSGPRPFDILDKRGDQEFIDVQSFDSDTSSDVSVQDSDPHSYYISKEFNDKECGYGDVLKTFYAKHLDEEKLKPLEDSGSASFYIPESHATDVQSFDSDIPSLEKYDSDEEAEFNYDGLNEEDAFGLNEFDENEENYFVEAFNDNGRELVVTYLQFQKKMQQEQEELRKTLGQLKAILSKADGILETLSKQSEPTENERDDRDDKAGNWRQLSSRESKKETGSKFRGDLSMGQNEEKIKEDMEKFTKSELEDWRRLSMKHLQLVDSDLRPVEEKNSSYSRKTSKEKLKMKDKNKYKEKKKDKISYIIEELVSTESKYIVDLRKVIRKYKPYVEEHEPESLSGKSVYIFGNIHKIYERSKSFLWTLRETIKSGGSYEEVARIFNDAKPLFELYPHYSRNKPTADVFLQEFKQIIIERQNELDDKLDLACYLLTPIQRLGKYILMLENIQKELLLRQKPSHALETAVEMIKSIMRKGNDFIAIDSITDCKLDLSLQGSCLMREEFTIVKPRKLQCIVFLFEDCIVFTKDGKTEFCYIDSIRLSDLNITIFEDDPLIFHLASYTKMKKLGINHSYVLEAKAPKIKTAWINAITDRLWEQLVEVRERQRQFFDKGSEYETLPRPGSKDPPMRSLSCF